MNPKFIKQLRDFLFRNKTFIPEYNPNINQIRSRAVYTYFHVAIFASFHGKNDLLIFLPRSPNDNDGNNEPVVFLNP